MPICERCKDLILEPNSVTLVTIGRPGVASSRRITVCAACAERLIQHLRIRPGSLADSGTGR